MKALVINGKKADFSLVYDGITIYPKDNSPKPNNTSEEDSRLNFVKHPFRSIRNFYEHKQRIKMEERIRKRKNMDFASDLSDAGMKRFIASDDEHELYHQDPYDRENTHTHM